MTIRRQTTNRLTLYRTCGTCGKSIVTTADTPWSRQIERDGKKQAITYFCSEKCFAASYKHIGWYDGKAEERRKLKEARRDTREKNRRYYAAHREEMRLRRIASYWKNPEESRMESKFYRKKRKVLRSAQ